MSQKVNIKKLNPDACIPTYGTAFSAGADLYSGMPEAVIPVKLVKINFHYMYPPLFVTSKSAIIVQQI